MRHHLQMIGVAAQPVAAGVINLLFARNEAKEIGEHHAVYRNRLAIQFHSWIAAASAIARSWASPDPATIRIGCGPGFDLFKDRLPAVLSIWVIVSHTKRTPIKACAGDEGGGASPALYRLWGGKHKRISCMK